MKKRLLKKWNVVRTAWLVIGIAICVGAVIEGNYFLLLPGIYFALGAIANIGCFAQSCAVNFKSEKESKSIESRTNLEEGFGKPPLKW